MEWHPSVRKKVESAKCRNVGNKLGKKTLGKIAERGKKRERKGGREVGK